MDNSSLLCFCAFQKINRSLIEDSDSEDEAVSASVHKPATPTNSPASSRSNSPDAGSAHRSRVRLSSSGSSRSPSPTGSRHNPASQEPMSQDAAAAENADSSDDGITESVQPGKGDLAQNR